MSDLPFVIAAFYQFRLIENCADIKPPLLSFCKQQGLKGTILLAREGINSTIAGSRAAIDALFVYLREACGIDGLTVKESFAQTQPFERMKVRLKREIVAMGTPELDVEGLKGTYIAPQDWDTFIAAPDVIVVDTRNDYEVMVGTFEGAVNPQTKRFRDFPRWADAHLGDKSQKIAMFCTGGIRCEKSTAYLKSRGFDQVYHLQGGILQYFEDTRNVNGAWKGGCFIFDDRAVLDEHLRPVAAVPCLGEGVKVTGDALKALAGSSKTHLKALSLKEKSSA